MKQKLRILHLENSSVDAALVENELRKAGIDFDILWVALKKDFLKGITEFLPHVVLSNHQVPDMDSAEALDFLKLKKCFIPFILITSTVSEKYAVDRMKQGAYDYVLKDQVQRLPEVIEQAIEKWRHRNDRKKSLKETIASEARYRQIVETAQEGIWVLDHEFRTTFVNQKMCQIVGYTSEEMMGCYNTDFMDEEGKAIALNVRQRRKDGIGETIELSFRTKNGKRVWASLSTSPIIDEEGIFKGALAMVTDITNRKEGQEKLRQERVLLRTLIDNLPDYIFVKDVHSRHLINNKANVNLLGFENEEETLGKSIADSLPDSQSQAFIKDDQHVLTTGIPIINKEECITTRTGKKHWLLTTKIPIKDNIGNVTGLIGISRDITERKQITEQLVANEKRFRALVENISDGIVVNDENTNLIYQSPSVTRILGYTEQERKNERIIKYVHPDYRAAYDALYAELKKIPGQPLPFLFPFLHKNESYVWLEGVITNLVNEPSVQAYVANYRDITIRKKTEEILQQSEANLRAIFDNTDDGFILLDPDYKILDYNDAAIKLMLLSNDSESKKGKSITEFMQGQRHDIFTTYLKRAHSGESVEYEVNYNIEDLNKWIRVCITSVNTSQNEFLGYCLTLNDYSEQKKAQQVIRANEERFRALVENTDDIIGIINLEGEMVYISPSAKRILGYQREELNDLGNGLLIHPDDKNYFDQFVSELYAHPGLLVQGRFRVKHKDNRWRWMEGSANNLLYMPSINGIVINLRDVTNQKIVADDLLEKKYFLEKAQEVAKVGYWISEPSDNNTLLIWSKETCRIFGMHEHEFDARVQTFIDFIYPDDRTKVLQLMQNASTGEEVYNIDYRIQLQNGSIRWVHDQAEITRDENGVALKMIGIIQDVTERKVIEEAMRQVNKQFELLSKATNDAIWDWDIPMEKVTWNHGLQTIFGYPEMQVIFSLDWWQDKVHPDDAVEFEQSITTAFNAKQNNWSLTYRFREAKGGYKYVYDRAYIIYDEEAKPLRMTGAMQDISARMQAMEEIEKLSFVASKTDNAVMIMDAEQNIEWVNESFVRMSGYTLDEIKGGNSTFLLGPESDTAMVQWMNTKISQGESFSGELINYSKAGHKYWLKLNIAPVHNDQGKLKNFISIQSDITQQKEFENKLTTIARELSNLIENANIPIFGFDRNGYINEWNKVSAQLLGFSKSELLGRRWIDELVGTDNQQASKQMIAHVLHGNPISNFELPVYTKNKKKLILLLSASPRRDMEKVIIGAIVVAQDITELIEYRRNLEKMVQDRTRELNEALQKEKDLVEMKSKFVSIASHEFRTPLSTIILAAGFLKKFKQKITPEEIDKKLNNIEKQVGHMTHLLDDVLMIGKVESGKIPVRLSIINTVEFFERLCNEIEQSSGKSHTIRLLHSLQMPTMLSDEKLLRNIVINTLTNAIKFSPGAPTVDLTVRSDADKVSIQIKDYGIGIPPEDMQQLFEPFHRGSNVNAIQGTGLGLSIIKKAVDLFKGFIDVKSEVGKGTELTITLPVFHE